MILTVKRRLLLAAISLSSAALLFRAVVAEALWMRGDEFLRVGKPQAAVSYYTRALFFDHDSEPAVDRFAITALEIRTVALLGEAAQRSKAYLDSHPDAAEIRADRALLLLASRNLADAAGELRIAAAQTHDERFGLIAAHIVLHAQKSRR